MENNDNKQKKTFHYVLLVTFLIIILIGLVCVLFVFGNNLKAQNDYNSVKSSVEATTAQIENSDTDLAENPIDFDALANTNDEIYAWITIPNTNIDYPVLQSKTSDLFYIDHDVNKNYLFAGSIYSEFSNLRNFSDRDTVLYGHNMLDGSMFADLHKFEDEDFFN